MQDRFWAKVDKSDYCWIWKSAINRGGYGTFTIGGKKKLAHRVSFELVNGEIPNNLKLDHLCRNRGCVNPAHLEMVTQKTNVLRGEGVAATYARRSECKNGHKFEDTNLYKTTGNRTGRTCRACVLSRGKEYSRRLQNA